MPTPLLERERFQEQQLESTHYKLKWLDVDSDARCRFQQLAMATYDALSSLGAVGILAFDPWPKSAGNALTKPCWLDRQGQTRLTLPDDIAQRWREWNADYFAIRSRNPKLELRDLLQDISESHDSSSWPDGYECRIQAWVDDGDPGAPTPFQDRHGIGTVDFFRRLQTLRKKLNGWMFWDDQISAVRFAPETEWQRFRAEQEATALRFQQEWEEARIRSERRAKRLPELIALARADEEFWSELQAWERDREASRPLKEEGIAGASQVPGWLTGRMSLQGGQAKIEDPPMDAMWAQLCRRLNKPDDAITKSDLVLAIRAEIRRELGYDDRLAWAGGPGVGEK